ncbi:serine hydrolase domain-containing protein [Jatrophihabitans lederbergiae]|uniref:Serine hydrolase domain-containing protein n=1 Tax=Jatrophihabitans lederbergiae TaxID=3075547 RepID=A0ABU2JF59_9ACTN|nr:serine hydrolase domain-containing protein [Jatrophihabitans sp. DSM 44399]MDT0263089.1 serine hydrolase domain-containing protein [Jatrophihabitans sp. DSM 44399]
MTKLDELGAWLNDRLPVLLSTHDVPAAAVAVCAGTEVIDAAAGLLSSATGVAATADSVFQIGSITKVWTATLVMQLVEEGRIDLDAPLRRHLPEFCLADEAAARAITVRQLLSHTAGFEGDIFTDTGTGEDCLEKYVTQLGDVPQLFPPGDLFSYNNAGYCLLGRLVEVLRGKPYDDCLREHLFAPLGLTHAATGPAEAIMFRAAVGHMRLAPEADQEPAPIWALARSNAPAGSRLAMRARDLLTFGQLHMNAGTGSGASTVLGPGTIKAMQEWQVELPDLRVLGNAWGLGWELFDAPGAVVIGHDGNTLGQAAFLRLVPERRVAVALLTNGGDAYALYRDVVGHALAELAGVDLPAPPVPPADPPRIDGSRYVGVFSSRVADLRVTQDDDGRIWVETRPKDVFAELGEQGDCKELVHFADDTLIPLKADHGMHLPHVFVGDDGAGRARYLHVGRAMPRADG